MKKTRAYTMRARARLVEETRQRVLDAAAGLLKVRMRTDITLDEVARTAAVSVPTVLRAFGSRADLLDAALQETLRAIRSGLDEAAPGDIDGSVHAWFDHYEEAGDAVVRNLADEEDPRVAPLVREGRRRHRQRVRRQLGPQLDRIAEADREVLLDALVCACDVYTWKLLRRDLGRSRPRAEATMAAMIRGLVQEER